MQTEIPHMEIKPEDLRKIQLKSLEMLLYFKDICDKNGLLFYFCGGCCIGALRDKGFIPWDDDIDILCQGGIMSAWLRFGLSRRITAATAIPVQRAIILPSCFLQL